MCLYEPKKLNQEEEIVCYKVLYKSSAGGVYDKDPDNLDIMYSPYYGSRYHMNRTKYTKCEGEVVNGHYIVNTEEKIDVSFLGDRPCTSTTSFKSFPCKVIHGALHSFKNLDDALYMADLLLANYDNTFVVKCVIPKTSKYAYEGFSEIGTKGKRRSPSYASQKLKPIEIVKHFNVWDELEYEMKGFNV